MKTQSIASHELADALGLRDREHVAFVGGGGKTTLMRAMAHSFVASGIPTIATTTTKMAANQADGFDLMIDPADEAVLARLAASSSTEGSAAGPLMAWSRIDGGKAIGVSPERCDHWFTASNDTTAVLVEADGARHRPFKAHGPFEPVIPSTATVVVSVIGADALGRVIADQCQRPLRVAALAGCSPYVRLTPVAAARVITHERGVTTSVPPDARFVVVATKVNDTNRPMIDDLLAELAATGVEQTVAVAFETG